MNAILAVLSAVVNSLWQALAVAALVWLVLRFVPRSTLSNNAATRHAIWWATLGVVLVLPAAPQLIRMMQSNPQPVAVKVIKAPIAAPAPVTAEPVIVTVVPGRAAIWPLAIFAVWAAILLWRIYQIGRSYFYLRNVKRRASVSPVPLPAIPRRVDLLISQDIVSPMAVGFLRPAIVLPESLLAELSEPERNHVLLHESAHLAKYDDWSNLVMRIMGGVLALHPVAIWILRRIEREREMACDDWVVARTGSARPYAASLARLVELRQTRRGEMLASGFFGGNSRIVDRIEILLRRGRIFSTRASAKAVATSAIVLSGLMLAGSLAPRWIAFAQAPRPSFEVASVKPSGPDEQLIFRLLPGGRYIARNVTLKILVANAYMVPELQVVGGPGWWESERFSIEAKVGGTLPPWPDSNKELSLRLQSLLEDRFKLSLHRETREEPAYDLVVAKGGAKLKTAPVDESAGFDLDGGRIRSMAVPLEYLAGILPTVLGKPVIDKRGLGAKYDYVLNFMPPNLAPNDAPVAADGLPSIFTALQEQLGLRLESTKRSVDVFVIDHVEKPDAN